MPLFEDTLGDCPENGAVGTTSRIVGQGPVTYLFPGVMPWGRSKGARSALSASQTY